MPSASWQKSNNPSSYGRLLCFGRLEGLYMKKLRILLLLAGVMISASGWSWDGSGKYDDPYLITSDYDWWELSTMVKHGTSYDGVFFKQTADIEVDTETCMSLLPSGNAFKGYYDGDGHTMDLSILTMDGAQASHACAAPFGTIENATIENLHLTGYIHTDYMRPASIAGYVRGHNSRIRNCWSEVEITSVYNNAVYAGGFVGQVNQSYAILIEGCLYTGNMFVNATYSSHSGGFVGYAERQSSVNLTNCVFAPSMLFVRVPFYDFVNASTLASCALENCYYNGITADESPAVEFSEEAHLAYWVKGDEGVTVAYDSEEEPSKTYDVSGIRIYENAFTAGGAVWGVQYTTLPVRFESSEGSGSFFANDNPVTNPAALWMSKNYTITFESDGEGIEEILANPATDGRKVLIDGQVYLKYNGRLYDVQGKEVR